MENDEVTGRYSSMFLHSNYFLVFAELSTIEIVATEAYNKEMLELNCQSVLPLHPPEEEWATTDLQVDTS